jgi:hypothetical protein
VLGNQDSIAVVPALQALGIRRPLNECVAFDRPIPNGEAK